MSVILSGKVLWRYFVCHTQLINLCLQLAQLIVNAGGVAAVVDYIGDCRGNVRLPGIMMLGYVAAHSENLAMAVIVSKVTNYSCYLLVTYVRLTVGY